MKAMRYVLVFMIALALAVPATPAPSHAKSQTASAQKSGAKVIKAKTRKKSKAIKKSAKSSRPAPDRYAALVVDASTGRVLYEKNAASVRYPASLTKMMTLYLTFDALKKNKISLDTMLPVSAKAAAQPQTNISLEKGDRLPVRSAIESLVVRSANDSAMVLAEALGKTEWNFALMMTKKARELGMKNTVFRNPSGLPDNKQHTTAYDMARLGIALKRDFPEYYHFFRKKSFAYQGVTYEGHNRVMGRYAGVDGIKTGYIRASGFNLVTSAKRGGNNLVAVVMGGSSATARDNDMISLLDRTFARLEGQERTLAAGFPSGARRTAYVPVSEAEGLPIGEGSGDAP